MPRCSSEKLVRPDGSIRQISPSTTAFGLLTALTIAFATSGKRPVRSFSLRERSVHSLPRT